MNRFPSEPSEPLTRAEEKSLCLLTERQHRDSEKRFLAEGTRVLEEALRHQQIPETLFVDAAGLTGRTEQLRAAFAARGARIRVIPSRQLARLSDVDQPQGAIGLFRAETTPISRLSASGATILWCDNLADPGNLGALCRSALAFGTKRLIISGDGVDPFHPKVTRASAGAIFGLEFVIAPADEILRWSKRSSATTLALGLAGHPWQDIRGEFVGRTSAAALILVVGSEAHGLPSAILDAASRIVRIEQDDTVESLNVAVAGAILLYELRG